MIDVTERDNSNGDSHLEDPILITSRNMVRCLTTHWPDLVRRQLVADDVERGAVGKLVELRYGRATWVEKKYLKLKQEDERWIWV